MGDSDGLHFLVRVAQLSLQVASQHRLAQVELHTLLDVLPQLRHLDGGGSRFQVVINVVFGPAVHFFVFDPFLRGALLIEQLLVEHFELPIDV